jgi:HEAT repeat protein
MLRSVLCRLVVSSAALLFALPGAAAQDAESLFESGVAAFQAGNSQQAIDAFKDALALNPGHEEAFRFWQKLEQDIVLQMLMDGGEIGSLATRFLGIARVGRRSVLSDPGGARDVVERYMQADAIEAEHALFELGNTYGEWAVPALIGPMADRADTNRRVLAIKALIRLGDLAVPALMQVLHSDDVTTRANAAAVLGTIGDARAAASLAWVALGDDDDLVQSVASESLSRLAPDLEAIGLRTRDAATLALQLATKWVKGDADLVKPYAGGQVAWRWQGGSLVGEPILAGLYHLHLAETTLSQALGLGGGSDIRAALAAVHASMKAEIRAAGAIDGLRDSQLLAAASARLPELELALAGAGSARGAALASLLSHDQSSAAAAMIGSMGPSTEEIGALREALDSDYQAVSVAAALVLGSQGSADARVVSVLGESLKSIPDRLVFSIGDTGLSGNSAGWQQLGSLHAAEGLMKAKQFPPKDVIVVRDSVGGVTLDTIIFGLLNDPRTADVPVVIVTDEADLVGDRYGSQIAAVVSSIDFDRVNSVAGASDRIAQQAAGRAVAAAELLAMLPASATAATAADVEQALLRSADETVTIAILGLAGRAQLALSEVENIVLTPGNSDELRIAALEAAASLWAGNGGASGAVEALREAIMTAVADGGTGPLGLAAARALGQLGGGPAGDMARG